VWKSERKHRLEAYATHIALVNAPETTMKIYTRTGDMGSTGLFGGPRVSKDDDRIEAYGTVDELNAALGAARSAGVPVDIDGQIALFQSELFSMGAELASPDPDKHGLRLIGEKHVARLEKMIDDHEATLTPLSHFILPAGSAAASNLHLARSICRRAERRVVTLVRRHEASVSESLLIYLNRLGDLLFVLSRVVNARAGVPEVLWVKPETED
jgi:cob(I)alamin adenosyltransferase